MILGGLVLSTALDECGLLKRIAYYVICKCGGTYKGTVFGCFLVGIILNIITFCNGWIVTCALVFGVCKAMGLKPGKEAALICFAGAVGSNGSVVMLYHPGFVSLRETSLQTFMPDYTMGIFTQVIYNGTYAIWCMLAFLVMIVAACMILLFSCELIFMPYQASGTLIMYSYGLLPMKEFIKQFAVKDAFMVIGFIVVMYPMWSLFGLI